MAETLQSLLILATALGCGLIAGVFFAFSTFVMKALSRLPTAQGITAMQSINIVVLNPWFLGVFFGTAALCVLLSVMAILRGLAPPGSGLLLAGSALYLLGTLGVTGVANVPRNESLVKLAADDPQAADRWAKYTREWTAWNHVRTVASLAAAAAFVLAGGPHA